MSKNITLTVTFSYDKDKYQKIERIFEKENQDIQEEVKRLVPMILDKFLKENEYELDEQISL